MLKTVSGIVLHTLHIPGISINNEGNIIRILSDVIVVKNPFNACGSCDVKTAYLKRGGMNNEALGGSNWVVSANFILLQANEESQFL